MRSEKRPGRGIGFLASGVLVLGGAAMARGAITVNAFDGGTLGSNGISTTTAFVGPYWVSLDDNPPDGPNPQYAGVEYRSYHKFDLSGLAVPVLSAQMVLEFPDGAYSSHYGSEMLLLYDVTTDQNGFGFDFGAGVGRAFSAAAYADFGDGLYFGGRTYSAADEGTLTTIDLSADAVATINAAAGGIFCIGGRMSGGGHGSITLTDMQVDTIFANTGLETDPRYGLPYTRQLILTVPEAGTLWTALMAAVVGGMRRRRSRT